MKKIIYTILCVALLTGVMACSSSDDDAPVVAIQRVSLPATLSIAVTNSAQLTPTTTPTTVTKPYTLVWSSDNETVATVDQNGLVTALTVGTANIRTQVYEDGVAQSIAAATKVTVASFTLSLASSSGSLEVGKTLPLEPTVGPAGSTYTLVWSSSNETAAQVDQQGVVTGRNEGESTITVYVQQQPTVKATFAVTVGAGEVNPGGGVGDIPDGGNW